MAQELTQEPDPATKAFEALRGEVALLRLAVTALAAERASLEIPDYSEDIGQLTKMVSSVGKRLVALSELPALALTPEGFSRQILAAGQTVRQQDQATIVIARDALQAATADVTRSLLSARDAHRQNKWLIRAASGGAVAGIFLWMFLVVPILRSLGIAFG